MPPDTITFDPVVWALLGQHAGDNAQILALANGLTRRLATKQLVFNRLSATPNVMLGASLLSISRASRTVLQPPWPDAIITAGRRSVPAARWVRKQSAGTSRLIHIGRPWAPPRWFDLIVTTPQYGLGERANVLHNLMPLTQVRTQGTDEEAEGWTARFAHLPRPWIAVLVGGSSRPHRFTISTAERLARAVSTSAEEAGGSLLVTFGPRAAPEAAAAFEAAITSPAYIHVARSHANSAQGNPYRAYLRLADRLIVTSDSASMIAEAAQTEKPVEVFPIPKRMDMRSAIGLRMARRAKRDDPLGRLSKMLLDTGLVTSVRDLDRYHEELRAAGMLGGGHAAATRQVQEFETAVASARALIASPRRQLVR
jgi:hypothetical protein